MPVKAISVVAKAEGKEKTKPGLVSGAQDSVHLMPAVERGQADHANGDSFVCCEE